MKKALLIGCGAEIGSNLLILSMKENFGFCIDTIVNNSIKLDTTFPDLNQAHAIAARLELAQPLKRDDIEVLSPEKLSIMGKKVNLISKSLDDFINSNNNRWDIIILATSKAHLQNHDLIKKLEDIGDRVFGMAESNLMTNIYPALLGFSSKFISQDKIKKSTKSISLGSCQTNGWLAQFRAILDIIKNIQNCNLKRVEIDIVHPDTPTGRLGTKSFSPREQDARNNLRPSFSQIEKAMKKLIPDVPAFHSVSLRVPIEEPGYQINKTYFTGDIYKNFDDKLENQFINFSKKNSPIMSYTKMPLGSKAFKYRESICHILPKPYLRFNKNCFNTNPQIHQIITQAYISNVYGYCLNALRTITFIIE